MNEMIVIELTEYMDFEVYRAEDGAVGVVIQDEDATRTRVVGCSDTPEGAAVLISCFCKDRVTSDEPGREVPPIAHFTLTCVRPFEALADGAVWRSRATEGDDTHAILEEILKGRSGR